MKRLTQFLALAVLGLPLATAVPSHAETGDEVMLQGFHWNAYQGGSWYNTLSGSANDIANSGIDIVWFPPPSRTADNAGYLPNEWYNMSSKYGNQGSLKGAIDALHGNGVFCVADIVINHRVGTTNWADFTNPSFPDNNRAIAAGDEYCCETGAADTGESYGAARDLDHTWSPVRDEIKSWLTWLESSTIGFDGWRYDMVKGFGAGYVKEYNDATGPYISIGEYFDYNRQSVINWINGTQGASRAFDFPTRDILYRATSYGEYWRLRDGDGNPGGLIGWWPQKAVTFIENHDTEEARGGEYTAPFPSGNSMQGYAYILTHPGIPCIFWHDWNEFRSELNTLIGIREGQGITDSSTVDIQVADSSKYAAIVNSNTAIKIGGGSWSPTGDWTLAASGSNYAVWTSGSGGGGGGGGGGTTVSVDPATPTAGQSVTITYPSGRSLASSSNVNLYWGTNGWTGVQTTAMTETGSNEWSVTVTVPSSATVLDFVFNNGSSWDNNGGADWHTTVTGGGGGGGGIGGTTVIVDPATPTAGSTVTVTYPSGRSLASSSNVNLYWGTNGWSGVQTTSMSNNGYNDWTATITLPSNATTLDFVFNNGSSWDNNSGADWHVTVTGGGGGGGGGGGSAYYWIEARHSGKALDVSANSMSNGGNIQQWDYVGAQNQQWEITDLGNGYYSIISRSSGKSLDVAGVSTSNGANIQQWTYGGAQNQQFEITDLGNGYVSIEARHSGKALDVQNASTSNGGNVHQWSYVGAQNQQWRLNEVP